MGDLLLVDDFKSKSRSYHALRNVTSEQLDQLFQKATAEAAQLAADYVEVPKDYDPRAS